MKQPPCEYRQPAMRQNGLSLSGKALIELMQAVHAKGRPFRFSAGGHSMAPFIRNGDVISVSPLFPPRLPGRGDVVAFLHPETKLLCVHRVLSGSGDTFLLQGDNLPGRSDGMISREAIIGRVTHVERRGRSVRLGLGPERLLLAILSQSGLLTIIRRHAGPLCGYFRRRNMPCERR